MSLVAAIAAASARFNVARRLEHRAPSGRTSAGRAEAWRVDHRMADRQVRRPGRVAEDQASLYACANRKSPIVGAPARRIRQRVLGESREEAQPLRHASQLAVLLALRVEQVLLHDGASSRSEP